MCRILLFVRLSPQPRFPLPPSLPTALAERQFPRDTTNGARGCAVNWCWEQTTTVSVLGGERVDDGIERVWMRRHVADRGSELEPEQFKVRRRVGLTMPQIAHWRC